MSTSDVQRSSTGHYYTLPLHGVPKHQSIICGNADSVQVYALAELGLTECPSTVTINDTTWYYAGVQDTYTRYTLTSAAISPIPDCHYPEFIPTSPFDMCAHIDKVRPSCSNSTCLTKGKPQEMICYRQKGIWQCIKCDSQLPITPDQMKHIEVGLSLKAGNIL